MSRIPLRKGDIVSSQNCQYVIQSVIGDGATGIVYDAVYYDDLKQAHTIRLKECYPYVANIKREGQELIWGNLKEKEEHSDKFIEGYLKLLKQQNSNFAVHIFNLFECNGTSYIVMDANDGVTFDQDNTESLSDILKTVKLLTYVVGEYHKNGYLHLDIKPSNFLVYPRPSEHIVLFDVDSIMAIADIKTGTVQCVPYSQGWAAPEQMQSRMDKLCPATDIYAIGAVLFEKVMGRTVTNDDIGIFANWDFEERIFDNVNPKIKRLLCNIFHKTLAANIKKRYQSTDELIIALEEAVNVIQNGVPYLLFDCPFPNKNFLGREKELQDIQKAFSDGNRAVFLHGLGGIGKSELAKKYADIHCKEYDAVVFLSYEGDLEDLIQNLDIQNCEAVDKEKDKVLKRVLKEQHILFIVDNFDVEIDEEQYLDKFLRLNADIIFTTRTNFRELSNDKIVQIDVENLNALQLICVFEKECDRKFSFEDRQIIGQILKSYNYYTLIVPILARQLVVSGWSLKKLEEKTRQGLRTFEDTEKICICKDGKIYKKTGLDMMRATFRMVKLSSIQKEVLTNLYLLRKFKINKAQYRKYLQDEKKSAQHIDAINELIRLGWVQREDVRNCENDPEIFFHPIIAQMIEVELSPSVSQNELTENYIRSYLPWWELSREDYDGSEIEEWTALEKDTIISKLEWFCVFVSSLDLDIADNLDYVADKLCALLNGNVFTFDLFSEIIYYFEHKLLKKIEELMDNSSINNVETYFKIANILEIQWCAQMQYLPENEQEEFHRQEMLKKYFYLAENCLKDLNDDFKNRAIWLLCKPIVQAIEQYGAESIFKNNKISNDIYKTVKKYEDIWLAQCEYDYIGGWDWEIDKKQQEQEEIDTLIDNICDGKTRVKKESIIADPYEEKLRYYSEKFFAGIDVDELNTEFLADTTLTNQDKNEIYGEIVNKACWRIQYPSGDQALLHQYIKNENWERVLKLLDYQEDHYANFDDINDPSTMYMCDTYRAVLYALQENGVEDFAHYMEILVDDFKCMVDRYNGNKPLESVRELSEITEFEDIYRILRLSFGTLPVCFDMLRTIEKCYMALPYLLDCAEYIHNKLKNCSDYSEDRMYSWYKTIVEFADQASMEDKDSYDKYFKIWSIYSSKLDQMTGRDFIIHSSDSDD